MQKDINLIYVAKKITYNGVIPREEFFDEMSHLAIWFPDCNFNALKLQELIPKFTSININKDIIDMEKVFIRPYQILDKAIPFLRVKILHPTFQNGGSFLPGD